MEMCKILHAPLAIRITRNWRRKVLRRAVILSMRGRNAFVLHWFPVRLATACRLDPWQDTPLVTAGRVAQLAEQLTLNQ